MKMAKKDLQILQKLNGVAGAALRSAGFRWSTRRIGDSQIGLWTNSNPWRNRIQQWQKKPPSPDKNKPIQPRRLVLVPGFGDSPFSWIPVLVLLKPALLTMYDEVVLLDFPGFNGFLKKENAMTSMDQLIASTKEVLDSLKPQILIGHSLGGWLSTLYAASAGESKNNHDYRGPEKLILVCPSGTFSDEEAKQEWNEFFHRVIHEDGFEDFRKVLFAKEPRWFALMAAEFEKFLKNEHIVSFSKTFREDHLVDSILPQIHSQVWLLWGQEDKLIPHRWIDAWLRGLTDRKAQCHQVLFKGLGHSLQLESPLSLALVLLQIFRNQVVPATIEQSPTSFMNLVMSKVE